MVPFSSGILMNFMNSQLNNIKVPCQPLPGVDSLTPQVIHPLDLSALNVVSPVTLPTASTEPLARGLAGGKLIYGEHLFAKVTSNFNFGSDDTT